MITSKDYLVAAFSEGFRPYREYLIFAALAEKEGYPQIAKIFRATAQRDRGLTPTPVWAVEVFRTALESLWDASSGGSRAVRHISPQMMIAAADAGRKKPPGSPRAANDQEKTHTSPYRKALARLAELAKGDYYVCSACGYTRERQRPEKCPHCRSGIITLVKVG